MTMHFTDMLPEQIGEKNAEWSTRTQAARIYKYGDLALKHLYSADFIDADTPEKRRAMLIAELEMGKIYNLGDAHNIFKSVITKRLEDGSLEPCLVMEWQKPETRLDVLIKSGAVSNANIFDTISQMTAAHESIQLTGEEGKFCCPQIFSARFRLNVDLAIDALNKVPSRDIRRLVDEFATVQKKLFNVPQANLFSKRLAAGYAKFSHGDTKSDNIYLRNDAPIFLDPVTIKQIWQCSDRFDELGAFSISVYEDAGAEMASHALEVYRSLDRSLTSEAVKFFWVVVANWSFVRAWVPLRHATFGCDQKTIDRHHDISRRRIEQALFFAEKAFSSMPTFEF